MRRRVRYGWGPSPHMMWMMCGPGRWRGYDYGEEDLEGLEELQRDLEEAAADIADRIRRLKEKQTESV
ncbi:MAG: hypothetical protein ACE5MI_06530 [Acidimicrobiia bacterium]